MQIPYKKENSIYDIIIILYILLYIITILVEVSMSIGWDHVFLNGYHYLSRKKIYS